MCYTKEKKRFSQPLWRRNCFVIGKEVVFMAALFLHYPKCTTCQNAQKWLEAHNIAFTARSITEDNPTTAELSVWLKLSGLPLKRFFNTSGLVYRDLKLKDKLPQMTQTEQLHLLSSNGMLVKRPILVLEDKVLVGFRPDEWEAALK